MDPAYTNKKIVELSDAELTTLGFLGDNVAPGIRRMVEEVKADPEHLSSVTCLMMNCVKDSETSLTSTTLSDAETLYSQLSNNSDAHTIVPPDLLSQYEINFWYHGISSNPPKLMWRSDSETNPFPVPPPGTNFFKIPSKNVHGVFNTPLNDVWGDIVAPRILKLMKDRGLKYSALQTARFSTVKDSNDETFGPIVVWIAVQPNTTNAGAVRDATPDILNILSDVQITGVVVEWYEASVVRL